MLASESFLWNADIPSDEPTAAYCAHLESIRCHLTIEDYSRVDAMNASGFAPTATAWRAWKSPRTCAPTIREKQTGRNWQRYAARTADYVFGPAGDRDLERNGRY